MKIRLLLVLASILAVLGLAARPAHAQMSDTERKSAARAAYTEGVKLQDDGKYAEALVRFEAAQKFFDAPTHLLHIAECQALTGRLVEASETYEALTRKSMPAGSPEAFVQAQQQGQAELPALRARVPTLRVTTKPDHAQLQGLQVNVNGVNMPVELLGIARPLNPGVYRFSAQAQGYATEKPIDVPLGEKEQKSIELTLVAKQGGPVVVAAPPPPYGQQPPPYQGNPNHQYTPRGNEDTTTPFGLLFGAKGGAFVPAGNLSANVPVSNVATAGGGFGLDFYFRLAKMMLIGGSFDYGALGTPSTIQNATGNFQTSASTLHGAFVIGILPSPDKTSFIGDLGIGSRGLSYKRTQTGSTVTTQNVDLSTSGFAFNLGVGVSIPAGPIRIVPKADMNVGSFSSGTTRSASGVTQSGDILDKGTYLMFFVGIAIYGSVGFGGAKADPAPSAASR